MQKKNSYVSTNGNQNQYFFILIILFLFHSHKMEAAEEEIFNKIIEAIQNMGETGATIDDLSQIVHLERHTLSKYLNRLRADGRLAYKRIGRAKVWFVSRAPLQYIFRLSEDEKTYTEKIFSHILSDIPEGVLVLDFDYNILFMNRYLIALYGDCIGQKYYHAFFDRPRETRGDKIGEITEGKSEEVESQMRDKEGRFLDIKARKTENPDGSFSIITIIEDVSEKVRREGRIKNLSELHRLLGQSVNRSYTIDQLCSSILENLHDVIGYDMGDILIYNPENNMLSSLAQIGYRQEVDLEDKHRKEIEKWKEDVATVAINRREPVFFEFNKEKKKKRKNVDEIENEFSSYAYDLAAEYNLQEMYAVPLKTKGELHGALLILMKSGRTLTKEDRSLLEGISEEIAGGIAKIKLEEELRLKANAIEISINPVLMADMEGKLTYVNPAFLNIWGYDREKEVLGRSCTEFWKQGEGEEGEEAKDILTVVQKKGNWKGELIGVRKDGSEFNARLSFSLIVGKKGPLQLVAVAEPLRRLN
jgi:PAS domain S-box-containing protein